MASTAPQWAAATELANQVREDLPASYILRVSDAAWNDLGIRVEDRPERTAPIGDQHVLVQKFLDTYKNPEQVDDGVPLQSRPGRGLYRIRRDSPGGDWRGACWADKQTGVVWLLRAVSLAEYPNENRAYEVFEGMSDDDLFPSEEERARAAQAQRLAHTLRALRDAMQDASELPEEWHEAQRRDAGDPLGEGEVVGRAYVERIEEEDGILIDRFLITFRRPPVEGLSGTDWVALLESRLFPPDSRVLPVTESGLPEGSHFDQSQEIALAQLD